MGTLAAEPPPVSIGCRPPVFLNGLAVFRIDHVAVVNVPVIEIDDAFQVRKRSLAHRVAVRQHAAHRLVWHATRALHQAGKLRAVRGSCPRRASLLRISGRR